MSEKSENTRRGIQLWTRFPSWRRLPVGALNVDERGGTPLPKGIAAVLESMFHLQVPLIEKILRPIIVYFFLIFLLRIFDKRELQQIRQQLPAGQE
ncbi:MAG: hypothetical protein ACYCOX_03430 [Acidobacteriaceae bacterium]